MLGKKQTVVNHKLQNHITDLLWDIRHTETMLAQLLTVGLGRNISLDMVSHNIVGRRAQSDVREGIFCIFVAKLPHKVKEFKDVWLSDRPGTIIFPESKGA